jgi:hypothetical protein
MGAAVFDHPEHPRGRGIGSLAITCSTRRPNGALVLVLDPHGRGVGWRPGRVAAAAGLDRGLLVGRDHELVWPQPLARKPALVQVEHDPALAAKSAARGKIHERCRHGLRASSSSQRQTVLTLSCSTSPQAMASSRTSATLMRLNGTARSTGSSQTIALTSAMTAGGKGPRPARPVPVSQARQALREEALAPLQCGVRRDAQALGDLLVLPTLRGCKYDPSPQHLPLLGLASAQTCLPRSRPASPAGSNAGACSSDCSCPRPEGRPQGRPVDHPASRRSRWLGRQEQVAVEAEEGLRAQHAQVCRPGVDLLGGQPLAADDEPGGDL